MKKTPRPINKMLRERLDKTAPEQRPAKLLELQFAELLMRAGTIGMATALTAAERLCKDQPRQFAELLHRIGSDYLHSTITPEGATPLPGVAQGS